MSTSAYEFSAEQNQALTGLARRMRTVGTVLIMVGVLVTAESVALMVKGTGTAVGFAIAAIFVLIGFWSLRAGGEFARIVTTQGADVPHLMQGLREIRKLYDVQFWAFVALAVLISLALFAVAVGPGRVTGPYP